MSVQTRPARAPSRPSAMPTARPPARWAWWAAAGSGVLVFLALVLQSGPSGRIYAPHRVVHPTTVFGISNWTTIIQVVCFTAWVLFLAYVIRANRRSGRPHPAFVVFIGLSACALQDPIQNWAVFAAYDPRLLHFPLSWPYFNLAPTVEPLLPLLLYPIAFGVPALVALALHKRLAARAAPGAWINRHPLLSTYLVGELIGIVTTFCSEFIATRLHTFTFTQLWARVTIFRGHEGQMHILYEGPFLGMVIALSAVLMQRDDDGHTVLDRRADRSRRLGTRPRLAVLLYGSLILSVYYAAYGLPYTLMRVTDSSHVLVQSWPYPNTKTYDPQGRYHQAGLPGPYYTGLWP